MIIERDVPIEVDDGLILRADVYRPETDAKVPVIMSLGPYGKGVKYQEHYKEMWDWLIEKHPAILPGSEHRYLTWETVDPEIWTEWGYACVRVDSRGAGRSPGRLEIYSNREAQDFYGAIEWAGTRSWSNGKVGLNGISYYAINQWNVASLQPPHLAAMIPWEGASDFYREFTRHGGILSNNFVRIWYPRQIAAVQHGNPSAPRDHWLNESAAGRDVLSDEDREVLRHDLAANQLARELDDEWYRSHSADFSKITVPFISAANLAGFGLHPRGNFEAFLNAASEEKWLEAHPGKHEEWFYLEYGLNLQRRFFDYYLKGEQNGWAEEPRVWLNIRRPFTEEVELRKENEYPLARTQWTKLYLNAAAEAMSWSPPAGEGRATFPALSDGVTWFSPPLDQETEITGHMVAKLFIASSTTDADFFVTVRAFSHDGREVDFQGTLDPRTPLGQGWLRASHRKLDPVKSLPWRPWHSHDDKQTLQPGKVYELDIEVWPTSIVLPAGFQIALTIAGKDFERPAEASAGMYGGRGSGPWLHDDPIDRPSEIFGGVTTLVSDPDQPSYLLLPIIPAE